MVVAQIRSIGWIADGLQTADEFNAAERMVNLGIDAPAGFERVAGRRNEFKAALRPMDLPALLSLQRMAQDRPERLAQLTSAAWFRDGTEHSRRVRDSRRALRTFHGSSRPEFDATVAKPGNASTWRLGAAASRSGSIIPIAIVRSGPAPPGSPVMAVSEAAVPVFEAMFDAEFPTPAIVIHVTDYVVGVAAGTNYQTHITLLPEIDDNSKPDFAPQAVYHEIAHYFLYAEPYWLAEGGVRFRRYLRPSRHRRRSAGIDQLSL